MLCVLCECVNNRKSCLCLLAHKFIRLGVDFSIVSLDIVLTVRMRNLFEVFVVCWLRYLPI